MTLEEMTRKERERQEKKLRKQLDKQQKVNIDNCHGFMMIIMKQQKVNNDYYRGLMMIRTGQTAEGEY